MTVFKNYLVYIIVFLGIYLFATGLLSLKNDENSIKKILSGILITALGFMLMYVLKG